MRPFVASYLEGRTPIPCTACNTEVKFKTLLARAEALGCDAVATGHYARVETDAATGENRLLKARDLSRDQSYFLYDLTSEQLSRVRFPLGDLEKTRVREIAREAGLPNWDKPDSQEICFVAERRDAGGLHPAGGAAARPRPTGDWRRAGRRDFLRRWREGRSARGNVRLHDRPAPGAEDFFE